MKFPLFLAAAALAFAQPPNTIRPGSPVASGVVNANFLGLYNGRVGRWSGSGVPGNLTFSLIGDLYYDTANPGKVYGCYRVHCTAVGANNWVLVSSSGTPGGSTNDFQVNNAGSFAGGRGGLDSSGNATFLGTVTTGSACSGCAGSDDMIAGTPAVVPSNSFGWGAPATFTTSLRLIPSNSLPSADNVMLFGAPSSNVSTFTWVGVSGSGSFALTVSPVFTTPNLGTPSAAVLTNATGLPIAGLTGLGSGVAAALAANVSGSGAICLASGSACSVGGGASSNAWILSNQYSGNAPFSTAGTTWGCGFWLSQGGTFGNVMVLIGTADIVNNYEAALYGSTGNLLTHTTPAPTLTTGNWQTLALSGAPVTLAAGKYYFATSAITSNTASVAAAFAVPIVQAQQQVALTVIPSTITPPADSYVMSGSTGGNICPEFALIP